jgi:predicted MFS family arabinose efflux permease
MNVTIIGDLFCARDRTEALGYTTLALSFGTAFFPIIGGLLGEYGWNYPFFMAVLAFPAAYLVHTRLDNPEPRGGANLRDYMIGVVRTALTRQAIALFLITFCTLMILYGPIASYMPVLLSDRFLASPVSTGLLLSVSSLFTGLASTFAGRLNYSFSNILILKFATILYIIAFLSIPWIGELWVLIIPVAMVGAAMGLNAPSRMSMLAGLANSDQRAAIMSVNGVFQRLGQTVSPVLMGVIAARISIDGVFMVATALGLTMFGLTLFLRDQDSSF